jgi:hypothetical protein
MLLLACAGRIAGKKGFGGGKVCVYVPCDENYSSSIFLLVDHGVFCSYGISKAVTREDNMPRVNIVAVLVFPASTPTPP